MIWGLCVLSVVSPGELLSGQKSTGLVSRPGFNSQLSAVWPWASHFAFLSFSILCPLLALFSNTPPTTTAMIFLMELFWISCFHWPAKSPIYLSNQYNPHFDGEACPFSVPTASEIDFPLDIFQIFFGWFECMTIHKDINTWRTGAIRSHSSLSSWDLAQCLAHSRCSITVGLHLGLYCFPTVQWQSTEFPEIASSNCKTGQMIFHRVDAK